MCFTLDRPNPPHHSSADRVASIIEGNAWLAGIRKEVEDRYGPVERREPEPPLSEQLLGYEL